MCKVIKKDGEWITWAEFFKEELSRYTCEYNDDLLNALDDIMEERR